MTTTTTGIKYEAGLDTAEAARRIRADIKAAQSRGELPALLRVSVRISRYSGGSSIRVYVEAAPLQIHTLEYLTHEHRTGGRVHFDGERWTAEARELLAKLEAIGGAYRRTQSDASGDYCNTNFFFFVQWDGALLSEDRQIVAEYVAAL